MRRFRRGRRRLGGLTPALAAAIAATTIFATAAPAGVAATSSRQPTIDSDRDRARYGQRVRLRGTASELAGERAVIEFRRNGGRRWSTARRIGVGDDGRYKARVRVRYSGSWRLRQAAATAASARESDSSARTSPGTSLRVRSRVKLKAERFEIVGRRVRLRGRIRPSGTKRRVIVRIGGDRLRTRADRDGEYRVRWRAGGTGRYRPRVKARGDRLAAGSRDRARKVTVYRRAHASWYGPGFYGSRTACGQTLTPSTLGVAHKTMPCGTRLRLRHAGRTVNVRVIDRGPYVAGREFDLTAETRERLRFGSTGTVLSSR